MSKLWSTLTQTTTTAAAAAEGFVVVSMEGDSKADSTPPAAKSSSSSSNKSCRDGYTWARRLVFRWGPAYVSNVYKITKDIYRTNRLFQAPTAKFPYSLNTRSLSLSKWVLLVSWFLALVGLWISWTKTQTFPNLRPPISSGHQIQLNKVRDIQSCTQLSN